MSFLISYRVGECQGLAYVEFPIAGDPPATVKLAQMYMHRVVNLKKGQTVLCAFPKVEQTFLGPYIDPDNPQVDLVAVARR